MNASTGWSDPKKWFMGILAALIVAAIGAGVSQLVPKRQDLPVPAGITLRNDSSAGQPLRSNMVTVGPSDGRWPETLSDLDGLCVVRNLPLGTRLTFSNIGHCDP